VLNIRWLEENLVLYQLGGLVGGERVRKIICMLSDMVIMMAMVWFVWNEKNNMIFNNKFKFL